VAKRDYYDVLGVTKPQKKNLKRQAKLITYFLMIREKQIMINLVMLLLKEQEEAKVLEDSISIPLLSLTYLKIFLEILVAEDHQEDLVIEEMI
jgi:hypothetical protein